MSSFSSSSSSSSSSSVPIYTVDSEISVQIDHNQFTTYGDIKKLITREHGISFEDDMLTVTVDKSQHVSEALDSDPFVASLIIRVVPSWLFVVVEDKGLIIPSPTAPIKIRKFATIKEIKQLFANRHHFLKGALSYCGSSCSDDDRLYDVLCTRHDPNDINTRKENIQLTATVRVNVKDIYADKECIIECQDFHLLSRVFESYELTQRRKMLGASLFKSEPAHFDFNHYLEQLGRANGQDIDDGIDAPEGDSKPLDAKLTLFQLNITDDTTLYLKTPIIQVCLKEHDNEKNKQQNNMQTDNDKLKPETFNVRDWFTVKQLKDKYNVIVSSRSSSSSSSSSSTSVVLLQSNDKLVYNHDALDDSSFLYKCNIFARPAPPPPPSDRDGRAPRSFPPRAVDIFIAREDVTAASHEYTCGNCGNDVRLKKADHVRCLECGFRILYKKRTTKSCQYDCR